MQVGWVGIGNLGSATARMVMRGGFPVAVWARREQTLEPFRNTEATIMPSLRELGAHCDLVEIMVNDDPGVEEVTHGMLEGMREGSVIANHTTGHPDTSRRLAEEAKKRGVTFIDAAISGGQRMIALDRELSGRPEPETPPGAPMTVMVGGDQATFERCLPVFKTFGDPVLLLGPVGSGQTAKLVNNSVLAANMVLADNALRLARSLGVDVPTMATILRASSGDSHALRLYLRNLRLGRLGGTAEELNEHMEAALRLAKESGADPGVLHAVGERISELLDVTDEVLR